ncbi:hypothetical protein [Streptomyces sp. NPDC088789]|uniref:hypothetical protein n=1 Tax=Streptomyces sp. NPDC088789 TaxID=3365899 RepID=UPI0038233B95
MTSVGGRAWLGARIATPLLAVVVVAAGAHLWLNTDVFTGEEMCGGLVSTGMAGSVLDGPGRVSDGEGLDTEPEDSLVFSCTLESTSFLPGAGGGELRISAARERGDFAFVEEGRWPSPAAVSFFPAVEGGATGAVGSDDHGWVLLPAGCTTQDGPVAVEGYAPEGTDPLQFTRLLTEVANRAAERADCAADRPLTPPDTLPVPPDPRPTEPVSVCGLPGLTFPGPPGQADVTERVQGETGPTWSCEVTGHAIYAITQDPALVTAVESSPGYKKQPDVAGLKLSGFAPTQVTADCDGTPTYFSLRVEQGYTEAIGQPLTPPLHDLFDSFLRNAGRWVGCGGGQGAAPNLSPAS